MKNSKSPILAGLLNFLFFGGGYLYLSKRVVFGIILLIAFIIMSIEFLLGQIGHFKNLVDTHSISITILAIALAYDGYHLAKE